MDITHTTWNLRCDSLEHKRDLLAYAQQHGIGCGRAVSDDDLGLGWNALQGQLYVFPAEWAGQDEPKTGRKVELITAERFRAMCRGCDVAAQLPEPAADAVFAVSVIATAPSRHHVAFVDLPALPDTIVPVSEQQHLINLLRPLAEALGVDHYFIGASQLEHLTRPSSNYTVYTYQLWCGSHCLSSGQSEFRASFADVCRQFLAEVEALVQAKCGQDETATIAALAGAAAL